MKLAVTAFIVTVVVGYLADCYLSYSWGWPDMGTVFAIATMGAFLLWQIQRKNKSN